MPAYDFACPVHGTTTLVRPMAEAGLPAYCGGCGKLLTRRYTGQAFIVRPTGYHLRPGDRGYADFDRAAELGEIRDPDERSHLAAGATVTSTLEHEPMRFEDDKYKNFRDACVAAYNAETGRSEW